MKVENKVFRRMFLEMVHIRLEDNYMNFRRNMQVFNLLISTKITQR